MDSCGDISIEGICALKQAQIQSQVGVRVARGINEQSKAVAAILLDAVKQPPQEGKGARVDVLA